MEIMNFRRSFWLVACRREVRERKRREEESTQGDIAELKKANIVIKNTNVCPLAETFVRMDGWMSEEVNG